MRASIDPGKCVGHGMCYSTAPEVYTDDPEGYGLVLHDGEVRSGHENDARTGARNCPEQAISLED